MSLVDLNSLTDSGVVTQYVIELMGAGHFLSRDDQSRIHRWLLQCASPDELLLILDEILPARIEKAREAGKKVFSLSSIGKTVDKRIKDRRSLVGAVTRED